MEKITWLGHAAVCIESPGCTILIDPFFTGNPSAVLSWDKLPKPDLVLVTHLHGDHAGDCVEICQKTGAMLGAVVDSCPVLVENGVPQGQIVNGIGFNIGGTVQVGSARITMTEAFHSAPAGCCTGFIITLQSGFTIYHAGDTGIFANMVTWGQLYSIDLALLPIGGIFTMDARQAALAATMLKAKAVAPIHWKTFPILAQEADSFVKALGLQASACKAVVMEPGEPLALASL